LGIAACQNEIDLEPNELGRNLASAVGEAIRCATVDDDATASTQAKPRSSFGCSPPATCLLARSRESIEGITQNTTFSKGVVGPKL